MSVPASRLAARTSQASRYFTGLECIHGHVAERYTSTGQCTVCLAMHDKRYRTTKPLAAVERTRNWRLRNPRRVRELGAKYRQRNQASRELAQQRWRACHPHYHSEWKRTNKGKVNSYTRNRRARIRGCNERYSAADIEFLFTAQRGRCAACRRHLRPSFHVDHIIPLHGGGENGRGNLQLLCRRCNCEKNTKNPITFMQSKGMLL